jgi:hypothetical protein
MWSREDWNSVTEFAPVQSSVTKFAPGPPHPQQILLGQQQFANVKLRLILGAFAKLRKVMSVHSSVCMEQLGSHWLNFHEIWYLSTFLKNLSKFKFN